jgi:hypothetical protein
MYIELHVKYPHSCQILIKFEFSRQIFEKLSNRKFHENPLRESQVVPRGRRDSRTDMMKLTVAFCSFADVPKTWFDERPDWVTERHTGGDEDKNIVSYE